MNNKLTYCKTCGNEVAQSASKCPHCGARRAPIERNPVGSVVAIIAVIFAMMVILDVFPFGGKPQPAKAESPTHTALATTAGGSETKTETTIKIEATGIILGPGTYTIGKDLAAGTYDCIASAGFGVFRGKVAAFGDPGFLQTMGVESDLIECAHSYTNLTLADGDVLYIEMSLNVEFVEK